MLKIKGFVIHLKLFWNNKIKIMSTKSRKWCPSHALNTI